MLETEWTLDQMAGQCGIGRTNFANYCDEFTNTSLITTIAMDVGFSCSQYFARKFKARDEMTAKQWRERTK